MALSSSGLSGLASSVSSQGSNSSNQGIANTEFDPLFIKAIRLLHSQAKDSADQLKALLDDVLNQRTHPTNHSNHSESSSLSDTRRGVKRPASSRSCSPISAGVIRYEPKDASEIKKEESNQDSESTDIEDDDSKPGNESSDSEDRTEQATDAGDFAMELGLACVVCKQIDVVSGNQLVECQECHSLYHQECHKPPVTDSDVSDPRLVWYCSKCQKNMKKVAATKPNKVPNKQPMNITPPQIPIIKETLPSPLSKPFTIIKSEPSTTPFKRTAQITTTISGQSSKPVISSSSSSSTSSTRPVGLAGFAANISKNSSLSSSNSSFNSGHKKPFSSTSFSSSGSSSSAPPPPTASMASADKRLQSMKKKAAQKQQRF